jgi:uridine kinase
VSIDDFYLDRAVLEARAAADPNITIDYDSEDTIDFEELERCVAQVFTDEPTLVPEFDFISGKRSGYRTIDSDKNDLFIFEGIQAIYPKVTELFRHYIYKSVYISVESAIDVGGTVFQPDEIRLIRRLVRDFNFRGASPEFTLYLWESVRANEELNIFPYAVDCDYFINSALPFEINLLKPYLDNILRKVPSDNKYYPEALRMLEKINGIEAVPESYISDDSLCYEFIKKTK